MRKEKMRVDIIIPIYNCKKYIDRCMKSLLSQKKQDDLRIILVDDGSTDGSENIIDNYKNKYKNVVAIHKKNAGVSSARNTGLKIVDSDYFTFIDPDDWIENDYVVKVLNELSTNPVDILMVPYSRWYKDKYIENYFLGKNNKRFNADETKSVILKRLFGLNDEQLTRPLRIDNISTVWGKFYKTKKFSKIVFKSIKEIHSEDLYFNIECFLKAQSCIYFAETKYIYFKGNSVSIVHTYDSELLHEYKNLYHAMRKIIKANNLDGQFVQALNNRIVINELTVLRNIFMSSLSYTNKLALAKKIMNDTLYKTAYSTFNIAKLPIQYRLFYYSCKHKMSLFIFILLQIGEKLKATIKE